MKPLLLISFLTLSLLSFSQAQQTGNIFIITTDGFRWQEIFSGADESLVGNATYVKDTATLKQLYWRNDIEERKKILMPFTWNIIATYGSMYGNRLYDNKVSVTNPYRFSYAGYNEIFTGYADPSIITNSKHWNRNDNILEFINKQPGYENTVAAFTSWNLFTYIFNDRKSNIYLNSGYQDITADSLTLVELLTNGIQQTVVDRENHCRNDMLTFVTAKEYIQKQHPKVAYISFGETDEHAHHKNYDDYLQSAHLFDEYLSQLWYLVNRDPFYKDNTTFIITTDHGRGNKMNTWCKHGPFIAGSDETWMMTIGPNLTANGEIKQPQEIFSDQIAQTIGKLLGLDFVNPQSIAAPIYSWLKK